MSSQHSLQTTSQRTRAKQGGPGRKASKPLCPGGCRRPGRVKDSGVCLNSPSRLLRHTARPCEQRPMKSLTPSSPQPRGMGEQGHAGPAHLQAEHHSLAAPHSGPRGAAASGSAVPPASRTSPRAHELRALAAARQVRKLVEKAAPPPHARAPRCPVGLTFLAAGPAAAKTSGRDALPHPPHAGARSPGHLGGRQDGPLVRPHTRSRPHDQISGLFNHTHSSSTSVLFTRLGGTSEGGSLKASPRPLVRNALLICPW